MHPLWSANVGAALRGLSLAREPGLILAWDSRHTIRLHERGGMVRCAREAPAPLAAACIADDGATIAAVGEAGQVWRLGLDLVPRWERKLPRPGLAIALDPSGRLVAASDNAGNLALYDRRGGRMCETETARPLRRLAFIPEHPRLIGAADLGLVACFDAELKSVWRDGLVANVGSLSVSGDGAAIALAGFNSGLYVYHRGGPPHRWMPLPLTCRQAALGYDGQLVLVMDQAFGLHLVDADQKVRSAFTLPAAAVESALSALGDWAAVAQADGTLLALGMTSSGR